MVIVSTENTADELYTKLLNMNKELNIRIGVNDTAAQKKVNIITITHNNAYICLGDIFEEYNNRKQQLDYFLVISEAHIFLQHI